MSENMHTNGRIEFDSEFLSKRLGRVCTRLGLIQPFGEDHDSNAAVAGTTLASVDRTVEALIKQRDEMAAELTALRLERDMRQMAEKRNAELLKQRDLLLKALKWIYRGEGKPVDVDAAIASVKGGA